MDRETAGKINDTTEKRRLVGLTPTPYQSGESAKERGISKAGNQPVRGMAIEIAWSWLRYQPEGKLSRWYNRRLAEGSSRVRWIGMVALAQKLLIELWKYLEIDEWRYILVVVETGCQVYGRKALKSRELFWLFHEVTQP